MDLCFVFFCGLVRICHGKWPLCKTVFLRVLNVLQCPLQLKHHRLPLLDLDTVVRALLLSSKCPKHCSVPDVCRRLRSLGIYVRNQACPLWERKKRPYRAGCRHRGKTVDTIRQKPPSTRYTDKNCSCSPISDGLLLQI